MINVSRVIRSRHFRQTIAVTRTTGSFAKGGWEADTPTTLSVIAVVWPSTPEEIQQVPEGDRVTGMVTFATIAPLYVSRKGASLQGISDYVTWNSEEYKILSLLPYKDYGYYMAVGARVKGA